MIAGDLGWRMGISGGRGHGSVSDATGRSLPPKPARGRSGPPPIGRAGRRMLTKWLRPQRWWATTLLRRLVRNDMHLLPRPIPSSATERQPVCVPELPLGTEISSLCGELRHAKASVHQWPATVHSRSAGVHTGQRIVHFPFAFDGPRNRRCGQSSSRISAISGQEATPSRVACSSSGLTSCSARIE